MIKIIGCLLVLLLVQGDLFAAKEPVPELDLKTLTGEQARLSDHVGNGQWVLVMFWSIDCAICQGEYPMLSKFHERHKNQKAMVLGVSIDGIEKAEQARQHVSKHKLAFNNYVAELGVLAVNFQIAAQEPFRGTPTYWFFSPEGELLGVNPGPVRAKALEAFMEKHQAKK